MSGTLIIGYGNVDRQDDGAAWHIINRLAERLGIPQPAFWDEDFEPFGEAHPITLTRRLQITPELSEDLAHYDRAVFIDAHVGDRSAEVVVEPVGDEAQPSPLTHHMTPAAVLALTRALYQRAPQAILVSVHGYVFGFGNALSEKTAPLVEQAADQIIAWLGTPG